MVFGSIQIIVRNAKGNDDPPNISERRLITTREARVWRVEVDGFVYKVVKNELRHAESVHLCPVEHP